MAVDTDSKELDLLGYWWLPDSSDRRVPGRLIWHPQDGGRLHLLGELRPIVFKDNPLSDGTVQRYRERRSKLENQFPVIHGETQHHAYTLLNSFSLNGVGLHGLEEMPENIAVNGVLAGAWYNDLDDIEADRAIFDLRHLTTWVDTNGLDTRFPAFDGQPDPYAVITANRLPPYVTSHDGTTVKLVQVLSHVGDQETMSGVSQAWRLVTVREPMGQLEQHTDIAMDIRALVTIATGKTADLEKVVIQHPELHAHNLAGQPIRAFRDDIVYYSRWAHRSDDSSPVHTFDLYFTLAQFGGAEAIGRWLAAAAAYPTELRRVMATRYTNEMYLEDRIMNTCAVLESFDAVRRGKPKNVDFVDRIKASVDLAGPPFHDLVASATDAWARRVVQARNHLAHHGQQFRTDGRIGERLLAEQLYWLFVLAFLRVCDAAPATFDAISKHREIHWLTEQAQGQSPA
ncbi:hypothetical protein [Nocardioides daejeonensis]|uniref:ApeA N-terminal domain 1-containing protein n=1 Tax=Nocardioides daejeonensis TaxID=1046556 RepID=UPI0013A5A1F5|nr:hypothetical protein [Nocardioides daejeonensis]